MDDNIASFTAITSADPQRAAQYLRLTDDNLEQAVQLFFDSPDLALSEQPQPSSSTAQPAASAPPNRPPRSVNYSEDDNGVVHIDSDDDMSDDFDMGGDTNSRPPAAPAAQSNDYSYEDDEAMARRLQEEMYGAGGPAGGDEDVRAPMARTTETLVGPGASWTSDEVDAMVAEQMAARRRPGRPGIFNQRPINSVWEDNDDDARRRNLSQATGGASEASSKSSLLAEMYRPPFDIMCQLPWDAARDQGKEDLKWLLVNIQDQAIFDCQVLNRDIWKNPQINELIKENFIFIQYTKDDPRASKYLQYYFHAHESQESYPHIAIVDPRTGEQVKVWSGPPVPKPMDFFGQLAEFIDRYSLDGRKNPVAARKSEKKKVDVERLSEEEQIQLAMQASMGDNGVLRAEDPDELTRMPGSSAKGKERVQDVDPMDTTDSGSGEVSDGSSAPASPFSRISSTKPHTEPAANEPNTTRIQFRHSGGRQVRRFALSDPVRRMYEWLKAAPLEGKEGTEFELIFMGKNLIDLLDSSIQDAGLKNGSVMVEYLDS